MLIRLFKDGSFEDYEGRKWDVSHLGRYLYERIDFAERITLGDLLRIVDKMPEKELLQDMANCPLDDFIKELDKPMDGRRLEGLSFNYLEIGWSAEEWDGDYNDFIDFCGIDESVSQEKHGSYDAKSERHLARRWALEFTPVNLIAHLEIKLNKEFKIYKFDTEKPSDPDKVAYQAIARDFKLIDVLYGILYEISFVGGPEDRDEKWSDLTETMKEIENGTAKTVPWEDVKKKIEDAIDEAEDEQK
jgi:hypothetical protein